MLSLKLFAYLVILHAFLSLLIFFKIICFEKFFQENNQSVSNRLDSVQARHFIGPDLGPNCLQKNQQTTLVGKDLSHTCNMIA